MIRNIMSAGGLGGEGAGEGYKVLLRLAAAALGVPFPWLRDGFLEGREQEREREKESEINRRRERERERERETERGRWRWRGRE